MHTGMSTRSTQLPAFSGFRNSSSIGFSLKEFSWSENTDRLTHISTGTATSCGIA